MEEVGSIMQLEQVQPVVYSDIYKPYKYGVIFKERLFLKNVIHGVVSFKIFQEG